MREIQKVCPDIAPLCTVAWSLPSTRPWLSSLHGAQNHGQRGRSAHASRGDTTRELHGGAHKCLRHTSDGGGVRRGGRLRDAGGVRRRRGDAGHGETSDGARGGTVRRRGARLRRRGDAAGGGGGRG